MRTLMVVGGPQHGEWWGIADFIRNVRAYGGDISLANILTEHPMRPVPYREVTLTVQWMMAPGWRIALPFLVHQDLMRGARVQVPPGAVMPGWIEGDVPDCLPIDAMSMFAPYWPIRRIKED